MHAKSFCREAYLFILGFAAGASAEPIAIPTVTGPYQVGVKKLEIPYVNTGDPIAPGNVTTSFLATAFYPIAKNCSTKQTPYLDPATAELYEVYRNVTIGTLANLTSALVRNAPPTQDLASFPTLIFGPGGWGPPTEVFTILLSDLASHGYAVFGLDHPYEQPFVRYPNGTGLYGLPLSFSSSDFKFIVQLHNIRINETIAFIDRLSLVETLLGVSINQTHLGTLGHSFGGSAAIGAALKDDRILSGVNTDGTFWDSLNSSSADVGRPVLLLGQEGHGIPGTGDITWETFLDAQTGWWRLLDVNGSKHWDFTDGTYWKEVTPFTTGSLGTVDGFRQVNITRTFVREFFDFTLKGKSPEIFDGPSEIWPEVDYAGGNNGNV